MTGATTRSRLGSATGAKACGSRFDDLTGTVLAGHHQPLRVWVLCLFFMGLNLSNQQIAMELGLSPSDVQAMTEQLRRGLVAKDAGGGAARGGGDRRGLRRGRAQGPARSGGQKGRLGRRRRLAGAPGRGTLEKDKPPILGLIQRGGQVVLRMLANVQQRTIKPIIDGRRRPRHPGPHRRVWRLRPPDGLGLSAQDGLPRPR